MKFLLISIFVLSFASTVENRPNKRFLKCDDVLATTVCDRFRNAASKVQLTANNVEDFVKDAYDKGLTKAEDIKSYVEKQLEEKLLSKSCEELTGGKAFCDQLDKLGMFLKKSKDDLKPYIVKAILKGKQTADSIKQEVEHFLKNDLMNMECEDVLTTDQCNRMKEVGAALKLKKDEIKQAMIDSAMKGFNKIEDGIKDTFENMKKMAEKFDCEDLLNPDVCVSIRHYSQKLRIGMPKMMRAVRTAIVMGYKVGKGFTKVVFKLADAFIDCEDFLSAESCGKIKEAAAKIGAKIPEVNAAIKDAVIKGMTQAETIYKNTLDYLKNIFGKK